MPIDETIQGSNGLMAQNSDWRQHKLDQQVSKSTITCLKHLIIKFPYFQTH